jgi:sarcosine oxidase delta subunit
VSRVCAHCGETYEEGRLVCPHCGADADLTWSGEPDEADLEDPSMDDEDYEAFLKREGLGGGGEGEHRSGCASTLLVLVLLGALLALA